MSNAKNLLTFEGQESILQVTAAQKLIRKMNRKAAVKIVIL